MMSIWLATLFSNAAWSCSSPFGHRARTVSRAALAWVGLTPSATLTNTWRSSWSVTLAW